MQRLEARNGRETERRIRVNPKNNQQHLLMTETKSFYGICDPGPYSTPLFHYGQTSHHEDLRLGCDCGIEE